MRIDSLRLMVLVLLSVAVFMACVYALATVMIAHWVFPYHAEGSRWVQEGHATGFPERFYTTPRLFTRMPARLTLGEVASSPRMEASSTVLTETWVERPRDHDEEPSLADEPLDPWSLFQSIPPTLHEALPIQPITINTLHRHNAPSLTPQWTVSLLSPVTPTLNADWE